MEPNEAIKWLKLDIEMMKFDPSTGESAFLNDDAKKVIESEELAIKALGKQIQKRVVMGEWKGHRATRYKCPTCHKLLKNDDKHCHRCGQKVLFPTIGFSPYVPGEIQQLIITWGDENDSLL